MKTAIRNNATFPSPFTGKERDEETGYGYFGARYMDHELMTMWLSVDPMADKYPNLSPYAYCAWNPIKIVDPDGRDNVIYIVNLQGRKASVDVNKIIKETNTRFEALGLETRAMLAPDGANFNPKYMDKTDSYALFGDAKSIKEFVKNNAPDQYGLYSRWLGGTLNPEKSENNRIRKGDVIGIDITALESAAARINIEVPTMAAFLILHGAGHNAGMNHSNELPRDNKQDQFNAAIMMSGGAESWFKNRSIDSVLDKNNNGYYIERMKASFGNNKSTRNYGNKKNKDLHPYIVF